MKKNHIPISFLEALKTCSKGSHQLVKWSCPNCNSSFIKTFKQALKTKLCKPCNNIVRPKPDFSGSNNPMYGISLSGRSGEDNPMWKGGKPKCPNCNKQLKDRRSEFCTKCWQLGDRNPVWNSSMTMEQRVKLRTNREHIDWAKAVKERDSYTCKACKQIGKQLHSHHLNSFSKFPEERYKLDNGVTLCKKCHWDFHTRYGKKLNTKEQFQEFLESLSNSL